ncbi:MAG TPA: UDP-N-acetylglucosamine diphosphorylase/glucosamine-1-phosphate N-acetyltransferase [Coxiellaceae bacterium]|nr:UDP-N-acetylglucosamine diphosphorylase/glucosamine-1-phosphate N-acetyltransferase [Coxiellaceae bacterium]
MNLLHIIILAAGKGSRMHSSVPKVLHTLGGKPLLEHVIQTAQNLHPKKIHVVCSDNSTSIRECFNQYDINWVEQTKQLGTGHAVIQALPFIEQASQVLILYGDVPLISTTTLEQLIEDMPAEGLSLLTAKFSDPTGLGRIIRDNLGAITAIVEHKDASPLQQDIKEINSGILATTSKILRNYLPRLHQHNAQGEYYLTDIIAMLHTDGIPVNCLLAINPEEIAGVNDQKQLAKLERQYQKNIADNLMSQGLNLADPTRFDVRGNLTIGSDVTIDINVIIEGNVAIDTCTTIGPNNFLKNTRIGKNVTVKASCVIEGAIIDDNCIIGPFARIRPNSYLESGSRVGNFVEVKNTKIGKNSKASHLSYLGDTIIGNDVNIGAGTITCNYDGVDKHQTIIEDLVFIGSNTALIAPIKIGKGAMIGAGSVIATDAPADKLTVARVKQITIENWSRKKKG